MAAVSTNGTMDPVMTDNGSKIKSKVLESTHGWTADSMKASGWTTTCTALVFILGKMAESMKENIKTIRNMDSEFTPGPMAGDTVAIGAEVNSMD